MKSLLIKKRLLLCLVLISAQKVIFGQVKISGTVTNSDGLSLAFASVTINDPKDNYIITYAITNEEGQYDIAVVSKLDSVNIGVSYLGYGEIEKLIPYRSQTIDFVLKEDPYQLKEIEVKAATGIRQDGDTISYFVERFKTEGDQVISDVLKKLPGIEVERTGRILFQGKPIQKFYIEGLDLLGGKYSLANENLPADAVEDVQILKNHQPIRMLDSLVKSDRASLNIKLKNSIAATGEGEFGLGVCPVLYQVNVTPMFFGKSQQFLVSYQGNNTGDNVANQLKKLTFEDLIELKGGWNNQQDWLSIPQVKPTSIGEMRWLNNEVHLLTPNYLAKLGNDFQLKINASYLRDTQDQFGTTATQFFTPEDTVTIIENKQNQLSFNLFETQTVLERNSKKNYLRNAFEFQQSGNEESGIITGSNGITQELILPSMEVSNRFNLLTPVGKKLVSFNSTILYKQINNQLEIAPGQFKELITGGLGYEHVLQDVNLRHTYSKHDVGFTYQLGEAVISSKSGVMTDLKKLSSAISTSENAELDDTFKNNLSYLQNSIYSDFESQLSIKRFRVDLNVSLKWIHFNIDDPGSDNSQNSKRVVAEPYLSISHKVGRRTNATLAYMLDNDFGQIRNLYKGNIILNYRNIQRNEGHLARVLNQTSSLYVTYKDISRSLFFNILYYYTHRTNNLLFGNSLAESGALTVESVDKRNTGHSHSMSFSSSKYYNPLKTTFRFSIDFNGDKNYQLFDQDITIIKTNLLNIELGIDMSIIDNVNFTYLAKLNLFQSVIDGESQRTIRTTENIGRLSYFPSTRWYTELGYSFYSNNIRTIDNWNSFLDFSCRYKTNKRWAFEARWMNILGNERFTTATANSFWYYNSTVRLRPSQFIVSAKFSF